MPAALHVETPLLESIPLSSACGAPVLLKMECFQPSGSFKLRGHGAAAARAVEEGAPELVASSGGNAGRAVAYAGRRLGVPVRVVVPRTTPEAARAAIRAEGATVIEHGADWDAAHVHALGLAEASGARYLHPFDDPLIHDGHASLVAELARQGPKPGALVLSVGGGGLLCGVAVGLARAGWDDVPVLAVETEGAASLRAALDVGRPVRLPAITSLATSLGARQVTSLALEVCARAPVESHVVSDGEAVEAALRFADDHRVLVEPACGAALAPVYARASQLAGRAPIVVIVCGGAGVTLELFAGWRARVAEHG